MTDPTFTHIAFLLDRSGSMQSIREDTVGGFAAFCEEQRGEPGRCTVSLSQFDTTYEQVYVDRRLEEVPPLQLVPRGSTALLDAIGRMVGELGSRLSALPEDQRPGSVVVGIMTDGLENSSRELTHAQVKDVIRHQTDVYGWQFMYMGADQDAVEVGTSIGVDPGLSVTYGRGSVDAAMRGAGRKASALRAAARAGLAPDAARAAHGYTADERAEALGSDDRA